MLRLDQMLFVIVVLIIVIVLTVLIADGKEKTK